MNKYYRIEDICKVKGGKRIPQGETLQKERNNHPYIRILDMYQGRILNLNNEIQYARLSYWDKIKSYIVDKGDVILAIVGNTLGMVSIIGDTLDKANLTENCCKFSELDKEVLPLFLYYSLISPLNQKQINVFKVGSSQPKLPIYNVNKLLVPKYNINIQKKIVGILSALDSKIELNNKINAELEAMAKTLYDYWFLQFEFPNEEGKPYKSSGGKMVWNEKLKREIPEGWTVAKLDDIAEMVTKSINPQKDQKYQYYSIPSFDETGTPIIESGENIDSNKYCVPNDAILVSKLNPQFKRLWYVGNTTEDSICSTEFIPFTSRNNTKEFLYSVLNSDSFYKFMVQSSSSSTGSRKRMQPELMKSFTLCYPSDEKIIYKYCKAVKDMFEKIIEGKKENQELASLRNFLLPLLMNGQVGFKE